MVAWQRVAQRREDSDEFPDGIRAHSGQMSAVPVSRNINSETNCKCAQGTANARKGVIDYRQQALRQGGHVS